jgi:CheY-like chemotaxis protein
MPWDPDAEEYHRRHELESEPVARVTVINDDPDFLDVMGDVLEALGHEARVMAAQPATLDDIASTRPDLLIVDLRLESSVLNDGWGVVVGSRAHDELRGVPVVLCTADAEFVRTRGHEISALTDVHPLPKPFGVDALEELIGRLLERFD